MQVVFYHIEIEIGLELAAQLDAPVIPLVQMPVLTRAVLYGEEAEVHGAVAIVVPDVKGVPLSFLNSVEAIIRCARGLGEEPSLSVFGLAL